MIKYKGTRSKGETKKERKNYRGSLLFILRPTHGEPRYPESP